MKRIITELELFFVETEDSDGATLLFDFRGRLAVIRGLSNMISMHMRWCAPRAPHRGSARTMFVLLLLLVVAILRPASTNNVGWLKLVGGVTYDGEAKVLMQSLTDRIDNKEVPIFDFSKEVETLSSCYSSLELTNVYYGYLNALRDYYFSSFISALKDPTYFDEEKDRYLLECRAAMRAAVPIGSSFSDWSFEVCQYTLISCKSSLTTCIT
jgi:hypothetical protein